MSVWLLALPSAFPASVPVWNEGKFLTSPFSLTVNLVRGGLECLHSVTLPGADLNVIEITIISQWECMTVEFYDVVCEAVFFPPTPRSPPVSLAASDMKSAMSIKWNVLSRG